MEEILNKYRGTGIRLTPQRIAILQFLEGNTGHPSADDIYREVRRKHPTISFATVYNTLQTLHQSGHLMEITIDPARKHYDPNISPHHHTVCMHCNEIMDVFMDYSDALKLPSHILKKFKPLRNHVDFIGLCNKCHEREKGGH